MTRASEWLEEVRALDLETLAALGVRWRDEGEDGGRVAIPYVEAGEQKALKVRAPGGKPYWQPKGAKFTLWNVDCLSDDTLRDQPVIITEGEYDALACIQAGFPRTVSVPSGAQSATRYVLDHADKIRRSPTVIIAADGDEDGGKMLRAVANALEGHECRYLDYPQGCKDANDILARHGAKALVQAIHGAKVIFPEDPKGGSITGFSDAPPAPDGQVFKAGDPSIDRVACWHCGFPTVVTGIPASGKSTWLTWAFSRVIRNHGIRIGASLLETPWPILRDQLARMEKGYGFDQLHRDQQDALSERIDHDWRLLHRVDDSEAGHDLGWFRDMMWAAAIRDGCKIIALDPWNEVDHVLTRGESVTDYTTMALKQMRIWAERYDVALCIVAHPTKMQRDPGSKPYPPGGYDISGSSSWYNKAAVGVTVHRTEDDNGQFTRVICWKSKFEHLYGFGRGQVEMLFDPIRMTYSKRPRMA